MRRKESKADLFVSRICLAEEGDTAKNSLLEATSDRERRRSQKQFTGGNFE